MPEIRILDKDNKSATYLPNTNKVLITKEKLSDEILSQYINTGYSVITI
jgi:hypothetical protein